MRSPVDARPAGGRWGRRRRALTPLSPVSSGLGGPPTGRRGAARGAHLAYHRPVRCVLPLLLVLTAAACDRGGGPPPPPPPEAPPSGGGRYTDGEGVARTLFRPLGVLTYGGSETTTLPEGDALVGYEFAAAPAATAVLTVTWSGDAPVSVSVHGPRNAVGLWGEALAADDGRGEVVVRHAVSTEGMYFVLLRGLGRGRPAVTVTLTCEGDCPAPACAEVAACDRVCPGGFERDADDCRVCACVDAGCGGGGCPAGQVCEAGACVDPCAGCPGVLDPVCGADGRTYPNACVAACRAVETVARGPCAGPPPCDRDRPCPDGLACVGGQCQPPACECAPERAPVCSVDGRTFANPCVADCLDADIDHRGGCLPDRCERDAECREGTRCVPASAALVPDNGRRCGRADDADCVKHCVPAPESCGDDAPCDDGRVCVGAEGDRPGFCAAACDDAPDACGPGMRCAAVGEGPATCLPLCTRDGRCPRGTTCAEAGGERGVCAPCACDEDPDAAPVCAEGRTYPGACAARCDGRQRFSAGACPDGPTDCADCPLSPRLFCGDDGTLYASGCEARCADAAPAPPEVCFEGPVRLGCRQDADCARTGCDGQVCAAGPADVCPDLSDEARCQATEGACGCVEGVCGFRTTPESAACVEERRR